MEFRYRAIRVLQSKSLKRLVLFSAKASEIADWSGVPQKKRFGEGGVSSGFQREENPERISNLTAFYSDQENIIQNPLLCALRDIPPSEVVFAPDETQADPGCETGTLHIRLPDLSDLSLEEVFRRVREHIEARVPEAAGRPVSPARLQELRARAVEEGVVVHEDTSDSRPEEGVIADDESSPVSVIFEETHILDFWEEIAARHELLKELRDKGGSFNGESLLGFDRDSMLSYLKSVVLVDGQHRLAGALRAAETELQSESSRRQIEERISEGESADAVKKALVLEHVRSLPLSLLMSTSPEEQVFQFIIVNQKATPIGKSLLGTIVSTSLAQEELDKVASRLKDAGIKLEESQAITYLARLPESPFCNLVERGLAGDAKDLLQWSVLGSLIAIFRDLKGGVLYGYRNDYADRWHEKYLDSSSLVDGYVAAGFEKKYDYWRSLNGPWRDVFIRFWTLVRDKFGDTSDKDRPNYWGNPRQSNLFNKISLTILAADFFQFLVEQKSPLATVGDIDDLFGLWLDDVNRQYFDRDWNLSGVKKDSTGIRNQWSYLWMEYRKSPSSLPDKRLYRQPRQA